VKKKFDQDNTSFFWSDYSAVIAWIKTEDAWGVFVWKMEEEISLTSRED
jgi:hypothetical protein